MKTHILSHSIASIFAWVLAIAPACAQSTWLGAGGTADWSDASNWDTAPLDGANLVFGTGFASGAVLNNDALASAGSLTFNTTLPSGGITLSGGALTLTGGIINNNTTAGRNVTINNNLAISGAQNWSTAADVDAVTILNGNLTGTGSITITAGAQSNSASLPTLRLGGINSGYTGTIAFTASDTGILLLSPQAQTAGLVDINGANRNLWLTANNAANPYTFWTGNATPAAGNPMAVNFRNAGTSGIYLAGGDVHWNPVSSGSDYEWDASRAGSNSEIRLNGSNDTTPTLPTPLQLSFLPTPRMLFFGNSTGSLVLGGNRSITNGTGGSNAGRVTMQFALSDDGTARQFTTSASLMILTRAAGGGPAVPNLGGTTRVTGGALAISSMDQIFNGWLELNGGVALLDNISWAQFTADRAAGYRASAGADAWGITGAGGGFAARGSDVTIFINADPGASYGTITAGAVFNRDFNLGSSARAADNTLYANARVIISQDTVLTAGRTIRVTGGNREHVSNWTVDGPVHEISGSISGAFPLTIGGGATTGGGTLRLSNTANSFSSLAINPSGQAGGVIVIAPDDLVLGGGTVTIGSGAQGQAGMLLFENQGAGQKTFAKPLTIAMGGDASSGDSGFGSWAGDVLYTGTVTVTGSRTTLPVRVHGGRLTFGAGSAIINDSTGATQTYSKGGAGELVLDGNTAYAGTNANLQWALREGTLVTAAADKLVNGTAVFDGDNIIGSDGVTWPSSTGSIAGWIPVSRTWKITGTSQSYTSTAMAYAGYTTVDVATGLTLTLSTGASPTSPSEARGNSNTTPRWELVKTGGGTWVFSNSDLASPQSSGPQNGAGFIRVDEGVLDITGDYGRGSLTLNGGTILSGAFSPFTYGSSTQPFTLGLSQANLLEITSAGGKLGISPTATGSVSRAGGINAWDQSGTSTLTLAARDNLDLVFANTVVGFPDVAAGSTLRIERDGTGSGKVQINDTTVLITGTLSGSGTLQIGATATGTLTVDGTVAPGSSTGTLDILGNIALSATATSSFQLGGALPGDGASFYDQLNVSGTASLGGALSLSVSGGFDPSGGIYYLLSRASGLGSFSGLNEGDPVTIAGGYTGNITYLADWTGTHAGSSLSGGNDVAIYNVIPEPGSATLMLAGLALLARRRRS